MGYTLKNIKNCPFEGLNKTYVSSGYGKRRFYNSKTGKYVTDFHDGLDMTSGVNVVAIASGEVVESRNTIKGYNEKEASGNYVLIKHSNNYYTIYAHLKHQTVRVKVGDKVNKGDYLGQKGSTGYSTGSHLHFALKESGKWVDPTPFLLGQKNFVEDKKYKEYIVKKGDTLSEIAKNNGVSIRDLVKLNNIKDANKIYIGQVIKIPNTITYIVVKGDTLSKIAKKYNVKWQDIYEKNKKIIGKDPSKIYPGQVLVI